MIFFVFQLEKNILLQNYTNENIIKKEGEMAEWLKAPAWKACILLKVSRVRIPFSPPIKFP
jgi:hypothetical protein